MKKQDPAHAAERRRFLKGMAVAGGATALATVFASRLTAADTTGTATRKTVQPASRGYHETDHIRDYYRTLS